MFISQKKFADYNLLLRRIAISAVPNPYQAYPHPQGMPRYSMLTMNDEGL